MTAPVAAEPTTRITVDVVGDYEFPVNITIKNAPGTPAYSRFYNVQPGLQFPIPFTGLRPGQYTVRITSHGYPAGWASETGGWVADLPGSGPLIAVGSTPVTVGPITIPVGGTMTGELVDTLGEPFIGGLTLTPIAATPPDRQGASESEAGESFESRESLDSRVTKVGLNETSYEVRTQLGNTKLVLVGEPGSYRFSRSGVPVGVDVHLGQETALGTVVVEDIFADVAAANQFALEIEWARAWGVSTGYPDGTFAPLAPVTREAMAAFLYRIALEPAFDVPTVSPFSDVTPSSPFYREISWLATSGISTCWADGTFRPKAPVARDAMAAFLFRYVSVAGLGVGTSQSQSAAHMTPTTSMFSDVATGDPFFSEIAFVSTRGISNGYPDGTYRPLDPVSRDAMAAFLHRTWSVS